MYGEFLGFERLLSAEPYACQVGATDLPKSLNRHVSKHGPDTDTLPCSEM